MNALITAGNTQSPIDRVRCITNIFTGKTGARLALTGYDLGHTITLMTSHPEVVEQLRPGFSPDPARWQILQYRTFQDLQKLLSRLIPESLFQAILHAAAVSDFELAGSYTAGAGTSFDPSTMNWYAEETPHLEDASAGKISSQHPELWLRFIQTPKLIDQFRSKWGYQGLLVKFKLEVGVTESGLIAIAKKSRAHSRADFLVANTLDSYESLAFLCDRQDQITRLEREQLPAVLWQQLEALVDA